MTHAHEHDSVPVEDIVDCIWRLDLDWRLTYVSPAAETMFGIPAAALIGSQLGDHLEAEDFHRLQERLRQALGHSDRTRPVLYETRVRHADGHLVPVEIHSRVVLDADGEPESIAGVARDITSRQRRERTTLDEENDRLQQQKMDAVAGLAGGMVDDLHRLVVALADCPEAAEKPGMLPLLEQAAARVFQLRTLAGRQDLVRRDLDIDATLAAILDAVRPELPQQYAVVLKPLAGGSTASVDLELLDQAIRALVVNACDAMPQGGMVTITTRVHEAERQPDGPPAARPRPWVVIEVRDIGEGLSPAVRERILEPFYTTREDGAAGLGLALTHGIVIQHGGRLEIESTPGGGSTFRILLPARFAGEVAEDTAEAAANDETILLVDDDPAVRRYCEQVLESAGYGVVSCADGVEALAVVSGGDSFDLMLLDWALPGLDGRRVREQVTRRHPDLPIMVISGYDREYYEALGGIDHETPWLKKPFTPAALLAAVRAMLPAPGPGS